MHPRDTSTIITPAHSPVVGVLRSGCTASLPPHLLPQALLTQLRHPQQPPLGVVRRQRWLHPLGVGNEARAGPRLRVGFPGLPGSLRCGKKRQPRGSCCQPRPKCPRRQSCCSSTSPCYLFLRAQNSLSALLHCSLCWRKGRARCPRRPCCLLLLACSCPWELAQQLRVWRLRKGRRPRSHLLHFHEAR